MKIRTKINLSATISVVLVTLLALSIYILSSQVEQELHRARVADAFARTITEFQILLDQYLAYQNPTDEDRLLNKLDEVMAQIEAADEIIPLDAIEIALGSLDAMVPNLLGIYQERIELVASQAPEAELARNRYLEERFAALSRADVQKVSASAFSIAEEARSQATQIQRRVNQITFGLTLFLILILSGVAVISTRSIAGPILQLTNGIGRISDGDTAYRLPTANQDEIGFLATAFNNLLDQQQALMADLKLGEIRYRTLVESSHDLIWEVDATGRITFMNPAAKTIYGYEPAEMIGWNFADLMDPADLEHAMQVFQDALVSGEQTFNYENRVRNKEGEIVILDAHAVVRRDEQGNIVGTMGTSQDITERKAAEERLRQSEKRFATVFQANPAAISITTLADGRFVEINQSYLDLSGFTRQELIGHTLEDIGIERKPEAREKLVQRLLAAESHMLQGDLLHFHTKDGQARDCLTSHTLIEIDDQPCIAFIAMDINERMEVERRLRIRSQELQLLTAKLAETEEAERHRLARELHDQVGQSLALLGFKLNMVQSQLSDPQTGIDDQEDELDDALDLVNEVSKGIRSVMDDLRPMVLIDYGLAAAINWYADRFRSRTDLAVEVNCPALVPRLPQEAANAFFRIVQEALTNTFRHARANYVTLILRDEDGRVTLEIADDGVGFDLSATQEARQRRSWGMINMRERATGVGATFAVETQVGQGTTIRVQINRSS